MTQTAQTTATAVLADGDAASTDNRTIHGVAISDDEITNGLHGMKKWPPEELKKAAPSLRGQTVTAAPNVGGLDVEGALIDTNHGKRVRVGQITGSAYEDGVGVVYEMDVENKEIYSALALGNLDVSIEASNPQEVDEDAETGALIMRGYVFDGMDVVEKGAARSNHTAAGPASNNAAIAALSAQDVSTMISESEDEDEDAALASSSVHTPSYSGTTTSSPSWADGSWERPSKSQFDSDDLSEIGRHFIASTSGFDSPDSYSDLKLPVVEPNGTLNLNGLKAANSRASQTSGLSDSDQSSAKSKIQNLADDEFDEDLGGEEAANEASDEEKMRRIAEEAVEESERKHRRRAQAAASSGDVDEAEAVDEMADAADEMAEAANEAAETVASAEEDAGDTDDSSEDFSGSHEDLSDIDEDAADTDDPSEGEVSADEEDDTVSQTAAEGSSNDNGTDVKKASDADESPESTESADDVEAGDEDPAGEDDDPETPESTSGSDSSDSDDSALEDGNNDEDPEAAEADSGTENENESSADADADADEADENEIDSTMAPTTPEDDEKSTEAENDDPEGQNQGQETNQSQPQSTDLNLDGQVVIDEERHDELKTKAAMAQQYEEENEDLKRNLKKREEQIDTVHSVYSAALADAGPHSEEFYGEMSLETLRKELSNTQGVDDDKAALEESVKSEQPLPQTGDQSSGADEATEAALEQADETAKDALKLDDTAALAQSEQSPRAYVEENFGVDATEFDDDIELRDTIYGEPEAAAGGDD